MTGLIHWLRLGLTCVWVICCISIVGVQWLLVELRRRSCAWQPATTRSRRLGVVRSGLHRRFVLNRLRVHSVAHLIACTREGWLLILCLSTAALIICTAG